MEQNSKIPSFLRLGAQSASGSHERSASPAGVSDAATPRGGYVDLRGSWYLYGQERLGVNPSDGMTSVVHSWRARPRSTSFTCVIVAPHRRRIYILSTEIHVAPLSCTMAHMMHCAHDRGDSLVTLSKGRPSCRSPLSHLCYPSATATHSLHMSDDSSGPPP